MCTGFRVHAASHTVCGFLPCAKGFAVDSVFSPFIKKEKLTPRNTNTMLNIGYLCEKQSPWVDLYTVIFNRAIQKNLGDWNRFQAAELTVQLWMVFPGLLCSRECTRSANEEQGSGLKEKRHSS